MPMIEVLDDHMRYSDSGPIAANAELTVRVRAYKNYVVKEAITAIDDGPVKRLLTWPTAASLLLRVCDKAIACYKEHFTIVTHDCHAPMTKEAVEEFLKNYYGAEPVSISIQESPSARLPAHACLYTPGERFMSVSSQGYFSAARDPRDPNIFEYQAVTADYSASIIISGIDMQDNDLATMSYDEATISVLTYSAAFQYQAYPSANIAADFRARYDENHTCTLSYDGSWFDMAKAENPCADFMPALKDFIDTIAPAGIKLIGRLARGDLDLSDEIENFVKSEPASFDHRFKKAIGLDFLP